MAEIVAKFLIDVRRNAQRPDMEDFNIEKGVWVSLDVIHQGLNQVLRLAAAGANKNGIAPPDMFEDLLYLGKLFRVALFDILEFVMHGFTNILLWFYRYFNQLYHQEQDHDQIISRRTAY